MVGLSEKKKYAEIHSYWETTFYGALMYSGALYHLNGTPCGSYCTEKEEKWISDNGEWMKIYPLDPPWEEGDFLLDIHFDPNCNDGRLRMKTVGYKGEKETAKND